MAPRAKRRRVRRVLERVVLGGVMSAAAFVIERRLLKAVRSKGERDRSRNGASGGLTAGPQEVEQQPERQGS
jgi:hypothetical protein